LSNREAGRDFGPPRFLFGEAKMYDSEEEIERLVRDFESCAIAAADFHHREHLVVAFWYLQTRSRDEALDAMRSGLFNFIDHHGVDRKKYKEEVTVFWVDAIASQLEAMKPELCLVEKCNQLIATLNSTTHKPAVLTEGEE
jgi:hypothetical protein